MEDLNKILNSHDAILLATIQKSGTHWFRYLFTNYYLLLEDENSKPVKYERLQYKLFPNNREYVKDSKAEYKQPEHNLQKYGFSDFYWQHRMGDLDEFKGKIIFMYRNPLDYLVSRYFYEESFYTKYEKPSDVMFIIEKYAENYNKMKNFVKDNERALMVSYEDLKKAPKVVFGVVLKWLGIPVYTDRISKAVEFSSLKNIQKEEKNRGKPIVGTTKSGFFVRDGRIGQFKEYLSKEDIEKIEKILSEHGSRIKEFFVA